MDNTKLLEILTERQKDLSLKLGNVGLILQGNIHKRVEVRPDPYNFGKKKEYGPYFQWTKKIKGKTVTVNLSESQAEIYGKAIEENRNLMSIINELREVSVQILDLTSEGVIKRKNKGNP